MIEYKQESVVHERHALLICFISFRYICVASISEKANNGFERFLIKILHEARNYPKFHVQIL